MNQAIKDYIASLDWRDIESAPKDGSYILVTIEYGYYYFVAWSKTRKCWVNWPDSDPMHYDDPFDPTHWMPLPDNRAAKVIEMLWECVDEIRVELGDIERISAAGGVAYNKARLTLAAVEELLSKEDG